MTNEQYQVREWMKKFGQECPEKPCIPSLEVRKLRAKLILEEALETIKYLGLQVCIKIPDVGYDSGISGYLDDGDNHGLFYLNGFEEHPVYEPCLIEIADGCEDLKVVTEGTLIACGLVDTEDEWCKDILFEEVMRSNNSKIWSDGTINKDKDGKVLKSPSYAPPNLQPIIDKLSGK